jgi:hypothetical protein
MYRCCDLNCNALIVTAESVGYVINTLFHCTIANEELYYGWVAVANTSLHAIMAWSSWGTRDTLYIVCCLRLAYDVRVMSTQSPGEN